MSQEIEVLAPLNPRQRHFAELLAIGTDKQIAYEAAGFKAHRGNAARLAADPRVLAVMETAAMVAARLCGVSLGRVLVEQSRIAFVNFYDCLERDEETGAIKTRGGVPVIDYTKMTREQFAAVSEIDRKNGKVKFHSKSAALGDLQKYLEPAKVGEGDAPAANVTNNNILTLIGKLEGETTSELGRRIAFALELDKRAAMKTVSPSPQPEPANG